MSDDEREMLLEMPAVQELLAEEREACIADVAGALSEAATDDPHTALRWAVEAIRARGNP